MTEFLANCAIATACKAADYINYNGWAFGVQWTANKNAAQGDYNSVTFVALMETVGVVWDTSANSIHQFTFPSTVTVGVAKPASGDMTENKLPGPFDNWSGESQTIGKKL